MWRLGWGPKTSTYKRLGVMAEKQKDAVDCLFNRHDTKGPFTVAAFHTGMV